MEDGLTQSFLLEALLYPFSIGNLLPLCENNMYYLQFAFKMYNFTSFAVSLNELEKGMEAILAPTDCRLRPDIRNMENGNMGMYLKKMFSH